MADIPLSNPDITDLERDAVIKALESAQLSFGPKVLEFEEKVAELVGTRHAVAVNSGTSALHLCIKALGVEPGDEVITTPFSFIASANCILYERATPVFVDIDPITLNLDVKQIESKITSKTKAILPVHVFGLPCDMGPILDLAKKYNLKILEDACEAIGASYEDKKVGGIGDCGVFGFYPNKQITMGEGGVLVTNNDDIASLCRSLKNQGRDEGAGWLAHSRLGYNYRISEIQCAIGVAQLQRIDEILQKRQRAATLYQKYLKNIPGIQLPAVKENSTRSWFVYVVILDEGSTLDQRNRILKNLKKQGVGCSNYFPPIHLQPFYVESFNYKPGNFSITESICERTIALPFYGNMKESDVACVADLLKKELESIAAPV